MNLFNELTEKQKFTADLIHKFQKEYGETFFKALEFIQKDGPNIQKNIFYPSKLEVWTVQGSKKDKYIIFPEIFCQCQSFLLTSIYRVRSFNLCKHLLAHKIAIALCQYETNTFKDKNYFEFIKNL